MIDFRHGYAEAAQLYDEIVVDLFAGGGGASMGIERALGRAVDVAVNHDHVAVACHERNHPATRHLRSDVFDVDPASVAGGRPVGLLWASPDCRHFSRAKGAKPVSKRVRSLAWVVCRWARAAAPRVIILENVREFMDWGPLVATERGDRPCPVRKGATFRRWVGQLQRLGYAVEWRVLDAADYGAPTHRRRLFVIARRDGRPIVWPEKTHGIQRMVGQGEGGDEATGMGRRGDRERKPERLGDVPRGRVQSRGCGTGGRAARGLRPYRTAAECIDWSIPCPSIFDRPRPLAEKTQARIAAGLVRYVLNNPRPFIVRICQNGSNGQNTGDVCSPLTTIVSKAEHCLVAPVLAGVGGRAGQSPERSPDRPGATVTTKADTAIISPVLVGVGGAVYSGKPTGADRPAGAVLPNDRRAVAAVHLVQTGYGEREGQAPRSLDPEKPLGTVVAGGAKHAAVAATLTKFYGGVVGHEIDRPAGTVTGIDHHAVTAAYLTRFYGTNNGSGGDVGQPAPTATAGAGGGHAGLVAAFLLKYYGANKGTGGGLDLPLDVITSIHRFGLVVVELCGEPYLVADIGLRMLTPRELARCQGFPDEYVLPTVQRDAVRLIGNSVCPPVAEAMVRANCADMMSGRRAPRPRAARGRRPVAHALGS